MESERTDVAQQRSRRMTNIMTKPMTRGAMEVPGSGRSELPRSSQTRGRCRTIPRVLDGCTEYGVASLGKEVPISAHVVPELELPVNEIRTGGS